MGAIIGVEFPKKARTVSGSGLLLLVFLMHGLFEEGRSLL